MNFVQLCREIKRKNDQIRERPCTCHPDDISPPCEHRYALTDCRMARLERQRDELRVLWERDSKALGEAIGQRDNARAVAEDNRGRYVTAEAQRDELAALLERAIAYVWHSANKEDCTACKIEAEARALLARLGEGGEG